MGSDGENSNKPLDKPVDEAVLLHRDALGFKTDPGASCSSVLIDHVQSLMKMPGDYIDAVGSKLLQAGSPAAIDLPGAMFKSGRKGIVDFEPRKEQAINLEKAVTKLAKDLRKKTGAFGIDQYTDYFTEALYKAYANDGVCGVSKLFSYFNDGLKTKGVEYNLSMKNYSGGTLEVHVANSHNLGTTIIYELTKLPPRREIPAPIAPPVVFGRHSINIQ